MLGTILLSVAVPIGATLGYLALRHWLPDRVADVRGIALQTVIIMVVLLAVAGAVAGVLLTRGGEAVSEVERQDITREAAEFSNERLCEAYGFSWAGGNCYSTVPVANPPSYYTDKASCESAVHLGVNLGYNFDGPDGTAGNADDVCGA